MKIVDHDENRSVDGGLGEESRDGIEQMEAGLFRVDRLRCRLGRVDEITQLRNDVDDARWRRTEGAPQLLRVSFLHKRPDCLCPGPVRGRALALIAASPQDVRAPGLGIPPGDLGRRPRLADPGFPHEHDECTSSVDGFDQRSFEVADLATPPDECAGKRTGWPFGHPRFSDSGSGASSSGSRGSSSLLDGTSSEESC